MKYLLLLLFAFLSYTTSAQLKGKLNFIPKEYAVSKKLPLEYHLGDTLIIQCEKVYLINKNRYDLYRKLHANILKPSDSGYHDMIANLQQQLSTLKKDYNDLMANCDQSTELGSEAIKGSIATLNKTNKELGTIQSNLGNSIENLKTTETLLRDARADKNKQNLISGIAGVGVGLLLGILLTN